MPSLAAGGPIRGDAGSLVMPSLRGEPRREGEVRAMEGGAISTGRSPFFLTLSWVLSLFSGDRQLITPDI